MHRRIFSSGSGLSTFSRCDKQKMSPDTAKGPLGSNISPVDTHPSMLMFLKLRHTCTKRAELNNKSLNKKYHHHWEEDFPRNTGSKVNQNNI